MKRIERQLLINRYCDELESQLKQGESPDLRERLEVIPESADEDFRNDLLSEFVELALIYSSDDFNNAVAKLQEHFPDKSEQIQLVAQRRSVKETRTVSDSTTNDEVANFISSVNLRSSKTEAMVGRYKLIRPIGEGGMGTVWHAEQKSPVQRQVALKLIRDDIIGKHVISRFEAERQAISLMNHPSIAKIFDAGNTESGSPYFVMELIEGTAINKYCDQQKLTIEERLKLFVQVCHAAHHAHQKGIIHRDLKPSNILVTKTNDEQIPKIIDFGLAKAMERETRLTGESIVTDLGIALGTLQYMSPDQAQMDPLGSDIRTDVYSLGVVLYELLVGSTPVTTGDVRSKSKLEVLKLICDVQPPRPSARLGSLDVSEATAVSAARSVSRKKLGQVLSSELDWVTMRALEKNASQRYGSASELANDISRFLNNEAVSARPPTKAYRLKKFVAKNKGLVTATAAMIGILLLGITGTTYGLVRANQLAVKNEQALHRETDLKEVAVAERQKAETAKRKADQNLELAKKSNEILTSVITGVNTSADYESVAEIRTAIADSAKQQLRNLDNLGSTIDVLHLKAELADAIVELGNPSDAIPVMGEVVSELESKFPDDDENLLNAKTTLGYAHLRNGDVGRAITLLEDTNARNIEKFGYDDRRSLFNQDRLAIAYIHSGQLEKATRILEKAHESSVNTFGESDTLSLTITNNLANLYDDIQPAKALPLFESAAEGLRETLGPNHRDTLIALMNSAATKIAVGRVDEAEAELNQVVPKLTRQLGETHEVVLKSKLNLAALYSRQGKLKEAIALSEETVAVAESKFGDQHELTLKSKAVLFSDQLAVGQMESAAEGLKKLLPQLESSFGETDHRTTVARLNLATAYQGVREFALALPLLERSARECPVVFGDTHRHSLVALSNLAESCRQVGDNEKALSTYEKLLPLMRETLGEDDPQALTVMSNLAVAYWSNKRLDKSIPLFEELVGKFKKMFGENHIQTQSSIANLAVNYRDDKQFDKAIDLLEEVHEKNKDEPQLNWVGSQLKNAYRMAGRKEKFSEFSDQQIARARKNQDACESESKSAIKLAAVLASNGSGYLELSMPEQAQLCLQEAVEIRQKEIPDDWRTANTKSLLGEVMLAGENTESACKLLEEAFNELQKNESIPKTIRSEILGSAIQRLIEAAKEIGDSELQTKWEQQKAVLEKSK